MRSPRLDFPPPRFGQGAIRPQRPAAALEPEDVARAIMYAVSQPPHVDVNEILIRPTAQK